MLVPEELKRAANEVMEHALENPTQEVCGLIVNGAVIRGLNVASGKMLMPNGETRDRLPETDFELDVGTLQIFLDEVERGAKVIIYHSHVKEEADFTASDVAGIYATRQPWLLVHTPTMAIQYLDPTAQEPYEGREWHWAYSNCHTLVRDWLKNEMNFSLIAPSPQKENAWEDDGWNEMLVNGDRQFTKITRDFGTLCRGDVLVMKIGPRAIAPNHVAVVVDPVNNLILHHLSDQLSCIRPLSEAYRKAVAQIYRVPNHA